MFHSSPKHLCLAPLLGLLLVGCTASVEDPEEAIDQATPLQAVAGAASDITLEIYSDGWGTLLETRTLPSEGSVTLDIAETEPYSDPPQYFVYARAAGFFTELYQCQKGGSIDVDLDAVPEASSAIAGTIFAEQSFFSDRTVDGQLIEVEGPNGWQGTITTDSQGRYGLQQLPRGTYTFQFDYVQFVEDPGSATTLVVPHDSDGVDYADLSFDEPAQAS